jgi:hypothetical protein
MSAPRLYDLLPTIYRRRDEAIYELERRQFEADEHQHEDARAEDLTVPPLRALFAILQPLYDTLEADIGGLYDDWFVETAQPEMLPYLAEPLAISDLAALAAGGGDVRAVIANIVGYRQRKGTAGALQDFARDATGWAVRVVDGLQSTAANVRVDGQNATFDGYVDVRRGAPQNSDIDAQPRTGHDVRNAIAGLRSVRVDVWRMKAAPTTGVEPGRAAGEMCRRTFSSLGHDKALMRPAQQTDDHGGYRFAVPFTRYDARFELGQTGKLSSVRVIVRNAKTESEPPLRIADLSAWAVPHEAGDPGTVYIDPELGRLLTPRNASRYAVDCYPATYGGIGAGVPARPWPGRFDCTILVAPNRRASDDDDEVTDSDEHFARRRTLTSALARAERARGRVRIILGDSQTHRPLPGPWVFRPGPDVDELSIESAPGARPTIDGSLTLLPAYKQIPICLRGLNARALIVSSANVLLALDSVTLHAPGGEEGPGQWCLETRAQSDHRVGPRIAISNSIVGGIHTAAGTELVLEKVIVMGCIAATESEASGPDIVTHAATFLGAVDAETLTASDSLFDAAVTTKAVHDGYVRYCAYRPDSLVPLSYRSFTTARRLLSSTTYGRLDFARLRIDAPVEVRMGAADGSEIGAYGPYAQVRRTTNLNRVLSEFLPFGVEARIEYRS